MEEMRRVANAARAKLAVLLQCLDPDFKDEVDIFPGAGQASFAPLFRVTASEVLIQRMLAGQLEPTLIEEAHIHRSYQFEIEEGKMTFHEIDTQRNLLPNEEWMNTPSELDDFNP